MMKKSLLPFLVLLIAAVALGVFPAPSVMAQDTTPQAATAPRVKKVAATAKSTITAPININTAGADELKNLPGVGPKLADQIVKYREANGPFKDIDDLKKVKGIRDKKFAKIKDKITIE